MECQKNNCREFKRYQIYIQAYGENGEPTSDVDDSPIESFDDESEAQERFDQMDYDDVSDLIPEDVPHASLVLEERDPETDAYIDTIDDKEVK